MDKLSNNTTKYTKRTATGDREEIWETVKTGVVDQVVDQGKRVPRHTPGLVRVGLNLPAWALGRFAGARLRIKSDETSHVEGYHGFFLNGNLETAPQNSL